MKYINRLFILLMLIWALKDHESFARFWGPVIAKLVLAFLALFNTVKSIITSA